MLEGGFANKLKFPVILIYPIIRLVKAFTMSLNGLERWLSR